MMQNSRRSDQTRNDAGGRRRRRGDKRTGGTYTLVVGGIGARKGNALGQHIAAALDDADLGAARIELGA